jgi:tetratricopeptide (TPR) repeat protein
VALCAARTIARNPDWNNDFTLTAHDVQSAPASFRAREMHGEFLAASDPTALEPAIAEEEIAWALRQRMPLAANYPQIPAGLGRLYGAMGDRVGAGTPAGIAWHAKALDVLRRATGIARATQQAFDDAQARAGEPPGRLLPNQLAWDFLALRCHAMGRHAEAIEALRQAREIDPANPRFYGAMADSYAALGDPATAAAIALEQALVFGFTPQAVAEIERRYAPVEGSCAIARQGGLAVLNSGCARVPGDLCRAMDDLSRMYEAARDAAHSREFRGRAAQAGCAAQPPLR